MITYIYCGLLAVFTLFLIVSTYNYLRKPAPSGDGSVGWALGIFYLAGLAAIVILALLLWRHKIAGLVILCTPLAFLALPTLKSKLIDLYAWFPVPNPAEPLTLHIINTTDALIHVKIECWFGRASSPTSFLYKTLIFTSKPLESTPHLLTAYQTALISKKSKSIHFVFYECIEEKGAEVSFQREIQPCMQFYMLAAESLASDELVIMIDAAKNSEAFRSEVKRLKMDNMYTYGAF